MAKCPRCGRKGLFLSLKNGLCNECNAIARNRMDVDQLDARRKGIEDQLNRLTAALADKEALHRSIVEKATAEGVANAKSAIRAEQDAADKKLAETLNQIKSEQDAAAHKLEESLFQLRANNDTATKSLNDTLQKLKTAELNLSVARTEEEKALKSVASAVRKIEKHRPLLRAIQNAIDTYDSGEFNNDIETAELLNEIESFITPTVTLDLQCLGMKELRKRYRQNEKLIEETLQKYEGRYTTKANMTIYKLMVIALKAELQNILFSINYGKLDDALSNINAVTEKYYTIATSGSQSIAPTMKKFIGEINFLFREAVNIEYEYYIQKERAKEEQRAIREQMRQEAEERRALELEKKKIEKEENKFQGQISQIEDQLASAEPDKVAQLEARLAELQAQLNAVKEKKDVITTLQNGKAGNVYVISNLGSFGDDVFKIGMTRRADPLERVAELGDASVPFPFDVHSFIFSDDAAALEHRIHEILNDRRVNKVNLRKEFFHISLDELETLVADLAPTAEFKRTMLAEQYRQSLSIEKIVEAYDTIFDDEE